MSSGTHAPRDTQTQLVELLHGSAPEFDVQTVLRRVRELLPNTELLPPGDQPGSIHFVHPMYELRLAEGSMPAQTIVAPNHKPYKLEEFTAELQQSWSCPEAGELLRGVRHQTMVTELFAHALEPQDRAMLFHGVLQALVEITRPTALAFRHSQQIVEAGQYLDDSAHPAAYRDGSLNVRFFRIEDTGDFLMDTRGLREIGLHDLQCHFRKLDPNDVSRVLRDVGAYLIEKGPVIRSGETVPGIAGKEKWLCQFEDAILGPARQVLDLNPGKRFAAGRRG